MTIPIWINEVQAISAPIIAGGAIFIAYQQARIAKQQARIANQQARVAKEKLRLDLYKRRYAIFSTVFSSMVAALNFSGQIIVDKDILDLGIAIREARFLFSANVFDYLTKIEKEVLQYRHGIITIANRQITQDASGQKLLEDHYEHGRWLLSNLYQLPITLTPFLKIDDELSSSREAAYEVSALEESLNFP